MKTLLMTIGLVLSLSATAQKSEIFTTKAGAIEGYDPVAYFTKGEAVKGNESYSTSWKEATWYFSSKENLDLFKASPEKYAPQFGGYCAYGVSKGALYKIDPDAWKIVNDKLYLNYNKSIQKDWEADQAAYIQKAEANWPKIVE